MTTGIILYPTDAGFSRENAALATGAPMPPIARLIVGTGTPNPDPASATALDQFRAAAVQTVVTQHTATSLIGRAAISPNDAYTITEVGIELADGTLYAYGVFPQPFLKGEGVGFDFPFVLSRQNLSNITLTVSILDAQALAQNIRDQVLADLQNQTGGIIGSSVTPISRAMQHVLRDGSPLMQIELFADPYNLRGGPALAISGVIAGDDSIDLAEHTETLLAGDYLIFGGGNTETVRLLANLELGRRRLQSDITHTYPTATLARTNWTITAGEAVAATGQVYYSKPLPLADNARTHRVIIRALTAAAAPVVAMRSDSSGDYSAGTLKNTRPAADGSADYSDYLYDVVCGDGVGHLRITTPAATRVRAIVLASVEHVPSIYDIAPDPEHARLRYERGGFLGVFGHGEFVELTTPGDGVFFVPPGVYRLRVRCLGAGASPTGVDVAAMHGGNGGGWALGSVDVYPGQTIHYHVAWSRDYGTIIDPKTDFDNGAVFGESGQQYPSIVPAAGGGRCATMTACGGIAHGTGGAAAGSQLGDGGSTAEGASGGAAVGNMSSDGLAGASAFSEPVSSWTGGADFWGNYKNTRVTGSSTGLIFVSLKPRFGGDWFFGAGGSIDYSDYTSGQGGVGGTHTSQTIGGDGAGGAGRDGRAGGWTWLAGDGGCFGGGGGEMTLYGVTPGNGGLGGGGGAPRREWGGRQYGCGGGGQIVIEW